MMRSFTFFLLSAGVFAQSSSTTYQTDMNGHRVATSASTQSATGERTSTTTALNGKCVPLEQSSERIVGPGVIERTIQKFDFSGRPAGTEKVLIEETNLPNGGKLIKETKSQADLNGRFTPVERRTSETRVNGQTSTTSVTVDLPTPNRDFKTSEKRSTVTVGPDGKQQSTETVERPDLTGRFRPVARTESSVQAAGDKTTQNAAAYQLDATGKMVLAKQTVATTVKRPGGDVTETNIYAPSTTGYAPGAALKLQEQRTNQRQIAADGSVTESVSVRVPDPRDATKLGEAQKVSETVCSGKCLPQPAATAPTAKKN